MKYYTNAGRDKTLNKYFDIPEKVMRNGVLVDIKANNANIFKAKKQKKKKA